VINKARAYAILAQKVDYIHSPAFEAHDAAATILAPIPECQRGASRSRPPPGVPPYIASLYADAPLFDRQQETHLFRKMNYLKFRAVKLRDSVDHTRPRSSDVGEIERLLNDAVAVRNEIIRSNLRLVVSIAKRYVRPHHDLFELISEANMSLILAVEKFDYARGFKFSTYATSVIIKNFTRSIFEETRWRNRFVTGQEVPFTTVADHRSGEYEFELDRRHVRKTVDRMLRRLSDRERKILVNRYGLAGADELTLERLGLELGISKERVRQIEGRAHEKLRQFADTVN
jgi:RNA polymerase primary sigma factor